MLATMSRIRSCALMPPARCGTAWTAMVFSPNASISTPILQQVVLHLHDAKELVRAQLDHLRDEQPLAGQQRAAHALAQFLVQDALVQGVLVDEEEAVRDLLDDVGVVDLHEWPLRAADWRCGRRGREATARASNCTVSWRRFVSPGQAPAESESAERLESRLALAGTLAGLEATVLSPPAPPAGGKSVACRRCRDEEFRASPPCDGFAAAEGRPRPRSRRAESCPARSSTARRPRRIAEAHLDLGGMHVHVHAVRLHLQAQEDRREAAALQPAAIRLGDGALDDAVADVSAVEEDVLTRPIASPAPGGR